MFILFMGLIAPMLSAMLIGMATGSFVLGMIVWLGMTGLSIHLMNKETYSNNAAGPGVGGGPGGAR